MNNNVLDTHTAAAPQGLSTTEQQALAVLQQQFGYDSFRGLQAPVVDTLIRGNSALVLMPTGAGKSLCYQIPALIRPGLAVVISPLIALMEDQVDALAQLDIRAAYLNSTLNFSQVNAIEDAMLNGELDIIYVAPERLCQTQTLALLGRCQLSLFAIDEAHCVSQWGHDFRADYLNLSQLSQHFPTVPRIALTATADEHTRREISARLHLDDAEHFVGGFDRPNIQYRIVQKQQAREQLRRFLKNEHCPSSPEQGHDCGIVYCLSRKRVDDTAKWLQEQGFKALPYHAGLSHEIRSQHQQRFLREDGVIIVATIAFGMGIDKPDVRFVAHLDLPKSIEAYYQETGRGGRDGLAATAWMAYGIQDVIQLRQMLDQSQAPDQIKRIERHKLDSMLGLCETTTCRRQSLLRYFGDVLEQPCGNCDTCLNPGQTYDGTLAAQKALSCIYRTGQRFGVNHLIDVLLGRDTDKIRQFQHQNLSTYGIGKEFSQAQWRSVYRQLIAGGWVAVNLQAYGALELRPESRPLLRGESPIQLRHDSEEKRISRKTNKSAVKLQNQEAWDQLRALRKRLAQELNVPPYVIFSDATLMDMLDRMPSNPDQFLAVHGVGASKLEKYGDAFLEVIAEIDSPNKLDQANANKQEILALLSINMDPIMIARQRGCAEHQVYQIAAEFIEQGLLQLEQVVGLTERQIAMIEDTLLMHDAIAEKGFNINQVAAELEGEFSGGIIRCVRAAVIREL